MLTLSQNVYIIFGTVVNLDFINNFNLHGMNKL